LRARGSARRLDCGVFLEISKRFDPNPLPSALRAVLNPERVNPPDIDIVSPTPPGE